MEGRGRRGGVEGSGREEEKRVGDRVGVRVVELRKMSVILWLFLKKVWVWGWGAEERKRRKRKRKMMDRSSR